MIRFWVLNITGGAVFLAGWVQGTVSSVVYGDVTRITWGIGLMTLIGLYAAYNRRWEALRYIAGILPLLGLLGTVIGIKIAIGGVEGQDFALRDFGIDTALNTTIAGIVGSLWLGFNEKIS